MATSLGIWNEDKKLKKHEKDSWCLIHKIFQTWLTFFSNSGPFVIACIMASDSFPSRFLMTDSIPSLLRTSVTNRSTASEKEAQSESKPPRKCVRQPLKKRGKIRFRKCSLWLLILTSRHSSNSRSKVSNDDSCAPCMTHSSSSWSAHVDISRRAYRWVDLQLHPVLPLLDRETVIGRWLHRHSAQSSDWLSAEYRRRAAANQKTSRGNSCSQHGSLGPLSLHRHLANEQHGDKPAEKDS